MGTEHFPDPDKFLFKGHIDDFPTRIDAPDDVDEILDDQVKRISKLQDVLYADGRHACLFVFQGMDCAGKDSTIKNVLSGVNPQGIHVANFGVPSERETDHSFLWRCWRELPRRGTIGVFNRSHYEEVLVMRVHPEFLEERKIPLPEIDHRFWQSRMDDLIGFEDHLGRNGIHVVKFFLNLSKDEQRDRLLGRINRPHKNWKFNPADMDERELWDQYREAFAAAVSATHNERCPWYVIPADDKPTMRALVAQIVADRLEALPLTYPEPTPKQLTALASAKAILERQ